MNTTLKVFLSFIFIILSGNFNQISAHKVKPISKETGCLAGRCHTCTCCLYYHNGNLSGVQQQSTNSWCKDSGKCTEWCGNYWTTETPTYSNHCGKPSYTCPSSNNPDLTKK